MARALGAEAHGDERGVAGSEGAAGAVDVQQCSLLGLGAAALLAAAARVSSRSLTRSCSYEGHGKESGVGGRVGQGREADRPDVPAILGRVLAPQEEHGAAQLQHGSQRRRAPVSALPRAHIRQMRQPEPRAARTSPAWLTRSAPSLPQTRASRRCASAARLQCSSHCNTLTLQHPSCIAATQLAGSPLAWGRRELEICRANVGGVWVYCHDQRGGGVLDTPRHTQACACVHPPRARAHTHTHQAQASGERRGYRRHARCTARARLPGARRWAPGSSPPGACSASTQDSAIALRTHAPTIRLQSPQTCAQV